MWNGKKFMGELINLNIQFGHLIFFASRSSSTNSKSFPYLFFWGDARTQSHSRSKREVPLPNCNILHSFSFRFHSIASFIIRN